MTVVVTEVSERFGCVVVGDSAVTVERTRVVHGAEKVQYASLPQIGFAIWGNACLSGKRLDALLASFIDQLPKAATPKSAGKDLASFLCDEATKDGRSWDKLRGGIHICGYQDALPVLYHVHTGKERPARQGPFQLHEDFPDARSGCQLRNGYYEMFGAAFDGMQRYAEGLAGLGFTWPNASVADRVSYHSIVVETIARTLEAAGRTLSVDRIVSAFAFNRDGMLIDKRQPRGTEDFCGDRDTLASFSVPPNQTQRTRIARAVRKCRA